MTEVRDVVKEGFGAKRATLTKDENEKVADAARAVCVVAGQMTPEPAVAMVILSVAAAMAAGASCMLGGFSEEHVEEQRQNGLRSFNETFDSAIKYWRDHPEAVEEARKAAAAQAANLEAPEGAKLN